MLWRKEVEVANKMKRFGLTLTMIWNLPLPLAFLKYCYLLFIGAAAGSSSTSTITTYFWPISLSSFSHHTFSFDLLKSQIQLNGRRFLPWQMNYHE
jgi:hypothetical protein